MKKKIIYGRNPELIAIVKAGEFTIYRNNRPIERGVFPHLETMPITEARIALKNIERGSKE